MDDVVALHSRPLALTADETLLDDLVRLAAAAGVTLDVIPDAGGLRRGWASAPLVLVGIDQAASLARAAPSRRPDVLMVGRRGEQLASDPWRAAVAIGAEDVLPLPDAESWLVERLADAAEGPGRDAPVIGVIGGRGGAGASILAAALATTAAHAGRATVLVDGDRMGGGADLVVGGEELVGLRWPGLVGARGRVGGSALRAALPRIGELAVLSWDGDDAPPIPAEAMRTVLAAARRGHDLVVVDLPRQLDEAAAEALSRCTVTLVVVPAEVRAVAAADRVVTAIRQATEEIRAVVRGPAPSGLDGATVATALGLPLVAMVPPEPRLSLMLERGEAPAARGKGPLAAFSRDFLADVRVPKAVA